MKAPKNKARPETSELADLVGRIDHLKQEHGPLLARIEGDRGMAAELRRELLQHLHEEEAEVIARLAAISPETAARYRASGLPQVGLTSAASPGTEPAGTPRSRLTVGSLRDPAPPGAPRSRAPSASPAAATTKVARLSVGSLRRG